LNASGIARKRSKLTYDDQKIANYSQFGTGQMQDEHGREYRFGNLSGDTTQPIPSLGLLNENNSRVHLIVRVKRKSMSERARIIKDSSLRKTIMFPSPGEKIVLRNSKSILKLQHPSAPNSLPSDNNTSEFRVIHVTPRDMNASTASVLVVQT